jgi:demethylmenaquinone methyltransferase/2-methoxy-6-polyprenyl-1,4-benzoquinol methylase
VPGPTPSPQDLQNADLHRLLRDPSKKQGFVTPMFEHIAARYDDFTRRFSFGMDAQWKALLLEWIAEQSPAPGHVVDVACGTGDLAFAVARQWPAAQILGVDAATRMIEQARARSGPRPGPSPVFATGDLMALPAADGEFDAATAGYAFRNAPSLDAALAEMHRVVRPGGWLYSLDFYRPTPRLWEAVFLTYLRAAGSVVGWWWHRSPVMYGYIAESIAAWVTAPAYEDALRSHGFDVRQRRAFLGGGVALHAARRR